MAVLALGGLTATLGTVLLASQPVAGLLVSVLGFVLIGAGVGAAGTSLLALLATATRPDPGSWRSWRSSRRRPSA